MKFSTRWRWITHDDRLEAGPFREKITAARITTPDRFVKNAEGIVAKKEKKETRRVHATRISCIHQELLIEFIMTRKAKIFWDQKHFSSRSLIRIF